MLGFRHVQPSVLATPEVFCLTSLGLPKDGSFKSMTMKMGFLTEPPGKAVSCLSLGSWPSPDCFWADCPGLRAPQEGEWKMVAVKREAWVLWRMSQPERPYLPSQVCVSSHVHACMCTYEHVILLSRPYSVSITMESQGVGPRHQYYLKIASGFQLQLNIRSNAEAHACRGLGAASRTANKNWR